MIILTIILLLTAAASNAIMDLSSEDRFKKDWWNKSTGWRYKYKDNDPDKGSKFIGSTTVFVLFTDGWHLSQFLFHTLWQLAITIQFEEHWWVYFLLYKFIFSSFFELAYSQLKKKYEQ